MTVACTKYDKCFVCGHFRSSHKQQRKCGALDAAGDVCDCEEFLTKDQALQRVADALGKAYVQNIHTMVAEEIKREGGGAV